MLKFSVLLEISNWWIAEVKKGSKRHCVKKVQNPFRVNNGHCKLRKNTIIDYAEGLGNLAGVGFFLDP